MPNSFPLSSALAENWPPHHPLLAPMAMPVHLALNVPPWGQGASLDHVAAAALAALATGIALQLHDAGPDLAGVASGRAKPDGQAMGYDHAPPIFAGSGRGMDAEQDPSKLTDIWGMKDFIWLT